MKLLENYAKVHNKLIILPFKNKKTKPNVKICRRSINRKPITRSFC